MNILRQKRIIKLYYSFDKSDKMLKAIDEFDRFKKMFKLRNTILKLKKNKDRKELFKIQLIGYDGKIKYVTNKIDFKNIIKKIDNMAIGKKEKLKNTDLYTDAHPEKTIKGLGFKNKEKAEYTLKKIKKLDHQSQYKIVNVLYFRAKYHPNKTKDIKEAIYIFKNWLKSYKSLKKN